MKRLLLSIALIVSAYGLEAQRQVSLNRLYMGTFDKVLDEISAEFGVKFIFDRKKLSQIDFNDRPVGSSLSSFLNTNCKKLKLKWTLTPESIYVILDRDQEFTTSVINRLENKKYNGGATRFGITVAGKIKDANSGESLPSANILIKGSLHGTTSNADGNFTLLKVPTDTSTIIVSYIGYATTEYKLDPQAANERLYVELTDAGLQLENVEVVAEREGILQTNKQISSIRMTPVSLSKLPNLGERDIMRSFQLMPGVSGSQESSSGLYVRGGTPDQNLILYDGFTIYHVDHLYGFYSAFNANGIKDVQLYKGGFEAMYGGRLSSVLDITGKEGNSKKFNLGGDISLLSLNLFTEIPIGKKITTLFAFRRSYKGPLYNKIFDLYQTDTQATQQQQRPGGGPGGSGPGGGGFGANSTTTIKSYFYDLNSKITFRPGTKDVFSISLFNGTDRLDNGQKIETPSFLAGQGINFGFDINDLTQYGNIGTSARWSRQVTNALYMNSIISYSNYYSNRDRSNEGQVNRNGTETSFKNGTLENNNLKDYSFKSDWIYNPDELNQFTAGLFGTHYDIAYTYSQNDTTKILDRRNTGNLYGGYVQDRLSFFESKLQITPGLRLSFFNITNKLYAEPRLSANYQFTPEIKLVGATGKYYQFANRVIREDILSGSRDFWILSDGDKVPVSSAMHYILGISRETKTYLFSIEGYYKAYQGLSEYSLRFRPSISGLSYDENFYSGIGHSAGVEFLVQRKTGSLNGWISYTLAKSQNHFDVYGKDYFPAAQDVRNEFKAVGIYNLKRWNFSATWIYATGRPYTVPEGGYELTLLDGSTRDYVSIGSKNGRRLPDYHRMDISIAYELNNSKGNSIGQIGFSIFNLYNRKNVWYKEFNIADGSIVESDITYLGITPNLSLSLKLQ